MHLVSSITCMTTFGFNDLLESPRHTVNGTLQLVVKFFVSEPCTNDACDELTLCGVSLLTYSPFHYTPDVLNRVQIRWIPWPRKDIHLIWLQELWYNFCFVAWSRIMHEYAVRCWAEPFTQLREHSSTHNMKILVFSIIPSTTWRRPGPLEQIMPQTMTFIGCLTVSETGAGLPGICHTRLLVAVWHLKWYMYSSLKHTVLQNSLGRFA